MSHLSYDLFFPFLRPRFFYLKFLRCHLFGSSFYSFACPCDYPCLPHFRSFCHIPTSSFEDSSVPGPVFFYFYYKLTHHLLLLACCLVVLSFGERCCVGCTGRIERVKRVILHILISFYDNNFSTPIFCLNWQ